MNLERILRKLAKGKTNGPKKTLKVLHIPTSGVNAGGITKFILDTMGELSAEKKLECHILSPFNVEHSLKKRLNNLGLSLVVINGRTRFPLGYFSKLLTYLRKNNFDLVHVHGSSSLMALELLAAKLAGVDVRIAHSHNTTCDHKFLHKLLRPLFLRSYTQALACSQAAGEWLFLANDFKVIYNGVDLQRFQFSERQRSAIRKSLGIARDTFILGHVGHFNQQKNHTFLIDVFQKIERVMPNANLLLIGTGSRKDQIKAKVEQLKLSDKVFFIGNVTDVYNWFSAMDVFILPSLFEGFSIVLAEAQANGLVSFAADNIPPTVVVTSKVHFVSLKKSSKYWAEMILQQAGVEHHLSEEEKRALKIFDGHEISTQLYEEYLTLLAK